MTINYKYQKKYSKRFDDFFLKINKSSNRFEFEPLSEYEPFQTGFFFIGANQLSYEIIYQVPKLLMILI